ncbi:unnamed protein product [Dibothriocephalus latus]|uniref:Uncharacterized protein n=1 Tax=Dibothriocephalus latus TaxID=60516 RepID=A0A3P7LC43_DIBLA|nr:unnamed protein product [Dibothriocephalus latus]
MGGIERGGKVYKIDCRRLLAAITEFKDGPQGKYLFRKSTPSTDSGLVGPHPRDPHSLESPKRNSEDFRDVVDEAYAAVVLAFRLIYIL